MKNKNLIISCQEPADARALEDLFRAYFPGIIVHHHIVDLSGENQSPSYDEASWLEIEESTGQSSFQVRLSIGGEIYQGQSQDSGRFLGEEAANKRRRLLRLSVHQALSTYLIATCQLVSPWGILTGVRPSKIVHRLFKQGLTASEIKDILVQEYDIQFGKANLLTKAVEVQVPYLTSCNLSRQVSIYVAIPFCPSRCHYCSFPAFALGRWGHLLEAYLADLTQEIRAVAANLASKGIGVQTIYVGGGTPTVLTVGQLAHLLELLQSQFRLEKDQEVTVEAGRPDTLDRQKLQVLKDYGVNRISINPQTIHDSTLEAIGRAHQVREIYHTYAMAREIGFSVINMDLIIGLPGENSELLADTLAQVIRLKPENITLHDLAIKRAAYYKHVGVSLPSSAEGARMTDLAQQTLADAGYQAYYLYRQKEIIGHGENVGYCLPDTASLYNILMMEEEQTILGLGVGAGSKIVNAINQSIDNFYNPKDLNLYHERLEQIISRKVDKLQSFVYNDCK